MTTSDFIALATGVVTLVGVVLVFGQLRTDGKLIDALQRGMQLA